MQLSKNFTLAELTVTDTGLPNFPNIDQTLKLFYLAQMILQPIRNRFGVTTVTSGFRSQVVNTAKHGSPTSQHLAGEAADFVCANATIDEVFDWASKNLTYGQIIKENAKGKQWVHISLVRINQPNGEKLTYDGISYKPFTS